jgi:murein endopeptidase
VQTFQRQQGLTADGIVGPVTEGALIAAGAGQPPGGAGGAPSSGTPGTGSPSSAIETFLPYSGTGYESKYTSSDLRFNQYGRSEAILALQWIARAWQRKHPNGPKLYIGPISKKGGGTLCYSDGMCHAEHKDGLDIDIRPVRNDQSKGGLKFTDASYSRQLTQELVDLAWSNRCVPVEKILFNDPAVNRVDYSSGHDDHLHVSFKVPTGSLPAACRSTGSGYGWELSEEPGQEWEAFLDDWEISDEFDAGEFYAGEFAAEEEFSLSSLPASVIRALRNGMESVALKLAMANGHRDENDLTNMIFFRRHQERGERKLSKGEPNFNRLASEWTAIRDRLVRPALRGLGTTSSAPSKPARSGGAKPVETYCTEVNPRGKNEALLMQQLAPFVQKYRGDIPIDFLLGWIAVESAGYIEATTRQCERGYFQLHPEEARGVGVDDPQRLSTGPEYSVQMGIEMVKGKMARAEQLGFARGTDLNRHFAKLLHWLPAYVPILVRLWNASGASPRTWKGFSDFVAKNRDEIVKAMAKQYPKNNLLDILKTTPGKSNADPVHGIMGVDKVLVRGPFWEERLRKMGALSGTRG